MGREEMRGNLEEIKKKCWDEGNIEKKAKWVRREMRV